MGDGDTAGPTPGDTIPAVAFPSRKGRNRGGWIRAASSARPVVRPVPDFGDDGLDPDQAGVEPRKLLAHVADLRAQASDLLANVADFATHDGDVTGRFSAHVADLAAYDGDVAAYDGDVAAKPIFHRLHAGIDSGDGNLDCADDHRGRGQHAGHHGDDVTRVREPRPRHCASFAHPTRHPAFSAAHDAESNIARLGL